MDEEVDVLVDPSGDAAEQKCDNNNKKQSKHAVANQLLDDPTTLAEVQNKLQSMGGYIESLPKPVRRRIKALKKNQNELISLESRYFEEVHKLECKYMDQYAVWQDKRAAIINGSVEPTDSDCDWPSDTEDDADLSADLAKVKVEEGKGDEEQPEEKSAEAGVPGFWLTIFKSVTLLSEMVQSHDEPILQHLEDIRLTMSEATPPGFTLHFHFGNNEFFTNKVLTKEYELKIEPDEKDPLSYDGPEIVKCKGCKIDWKTGKDVTVRLVKKVQRHKAKGMQRTVTKSVKNDSFFNFFDPPVVEQEDTDDMDEDTEALLEADFEIGHFIRDRIVGRAVLYFTGEAVDDEIDDEEDDDEDDDADDENNDDTDPDHSPNKDGKAQECQQS